MDDGRQVITKVPNPNAGLPFYTTASEVATMDFVSYLTLLYAQHMKLNFLWVRRVHC